MRSEFRDMLHGVADVARTLFAVLLILAAWSFGVYLAASKIPATCPQCGARLTPADRVAVEE